MSQVETMHPGMEPAESPLTPESWGKLGMWIFLVGDAMGFGTLLAAYGAMRFGSADWHNPYQRLGINLTAFMTFLLICSSVTMVKGLEGVKNGKRGTAQIYLLLTIIGGAGFLGLQAYEWTRLLHFGLTASSGTYGATFYTLVGAHGAHVLGALIWLSLVLVAARRGRFTARTHVPVTLCGMFWFFVVFVWPVLYVLVYLG